MKLLVRMVNSQREFFRRNIISEHQIQLVGIAFLSGNRRNRVVRLSVSLRVDKGSLIRIGPPVSQNFISQINKPFRVCSAKTQELTWASKRFPPLHLRITFHGKVLFNRCLCHGKCIMAALEMVVA